MFFSVVVVVVFQSIMIGCGNFNAYNDPKVTETWNFSYLLSSPYHMTALFSDCTQFSDVIVITIQ